MTNLVFLLEELSAKALLENLVPRLLSADRYYFYFVPFEGKQDLEKQLVRKLRGWIAPNTHFIVMRDQDAADCKKVKKRLVSLCEQAGRPDTLVRIACRELESWYLGDLQALSRAFDMNDLAAKQNKRKYRNPDLLQNPADELTRLTGGRYQKVSGSRTLGPLLNVASNCSRSFQVFISGVINLVEPAG